MVLDIACFRPTDDPDADGPEKVKQGQRWRYHDEGLVDQVTEADTNWRKFQFKADCLKRLKNLVPKKIRDKMKAKNPGSAESAVEAGFTDSIIDLSMAKSKPEAIEEKLESLSVAQLKTVVAEIKDLEVKNNTDTAAALASRDGLRRQIGNFLHETVPKFEKEEDNVIERTIGPVGEEFRRKFSHVDLIVMIDGVDHERGVTVSGNRGYFLKGPGVALEQALVSFAHDFLASRGSTPLSPPVFMNKDVMSEVAQLSQFAEELYKVSCRRSEVESDTAEEEKFLIATGEQPIAAFHRKERFMAKDLPIRYAGISECFRQEVGSSGRDSKGIFRVHQFKKIEQFCITEPGKSWEMFQEMIGNAEAFTQALGLSYQVVNIVSGDLNLAAAKKFDLEAWFPGQGNFRELVSCSNCLDYQSRRLDIKFGGKKQASDPTASDRTSYVHMLNSTLCATTRVICCILESYQVGDFETGGGIVVPEVLRKYMPDSYGDFLPFVKAPPDAEADEKKKGKGKGGGGKKKK